MVNVQGVESAKIFGYLSILTGIKTDSENNKAPITIQLFAEKLTHLFLRPC